MQVSLISSPCITGEQLAGMASATCTHSADLKRSLRGSLSSGHESVLEHVNYTFLISGVSRVLLAQLTRHRIASYSVESQRYCEVKDDTDYILPAKIGEDPSAKEVFTNAVGTAHEAYKKLIKLGIPKEDARYVLPQCVSCTLVLTMNARELRHFFSLRCCNRAQEEIRELADTMLELVMRKDPILFKDAGPGCVRGRCPEGARSCGHPRVM